MTFKGFIRNKQQTMGILGLLLIVLSLTGLLGCTPPTPTVASDITGEFTYDALSAVEGNAQTSPAPTWTGITDDKQTVKYSITTRPNGANADHVTVDTKGVVTITEQAPVASSGAYTVTATGTGDWQGTKTATIQITITAEKKAIDGQFSYEGLSAVEGNAQTSPAPTWTGITDDKQTVKYSITTRPNGANADHVTINTATGVVTITKDAPVAGPGAYTVTATGTGDWQGTKTATIQITITAKEKAIDGQFSYIALSAVAGTAQTSSVPAWTSAEPGQTVEYSITSRPIGADATHVTVNTEGVVTVTEQARKSSSGTYTVTATGTGDFAGTIEATINITIDNTPIDGGFSYIALSTEQGTAETSPVPIWTGAVAGQTVEYSITARPRGANPAHVTIVKATGVVTVTKDAPVAGPGAYTITATGIGDFIGDIEGSIDITILAPPKLITGKLSYEELEANHNNIPIQLLPQWREVEDFDQFRPGNTEYSIASPAGNAGTGVTLDKGDGSVTVDSTATMASAGTYTVTAKGIGAFQGGTIVGYFKLTWRN